MVRCIAIDDEPLGLELLMDSIGQVPYLQLVGAFNNPLEALTLLQQQEVDLVFLDIQMPGITGLQFIQSLKNPPMFILVTAYEKYALEGYSLNVVDYLVKPVAMDRFIKACGKALELYQLKKGGSEGKAATSYFFINVDYSLLKVVYADMIYIEGLKDYIKIHLKSTAKPIVSRMTLKVLEEQLPAQFIRIHKSYIVSKDSITAVKKNNIFLGTLELPIGESYKDVVDQIVQRGN
jgi:two-component system LytT family response regulator